jgi:hypothetical protein
VFIGEGFVLFCDLRFHRQRDFVPFSDIITLVQHARKNRLTRLREGSVNVILFALLKLTFREKLNRDLLSAMAKDADILLLAGDLSDTVLPEESRCSPR